jgi:hypothetical protein
MRKQHTKQLTLTRETLRQVLGAEYSTHPIKPSGITCISCTPMPCVTK